MLALEDLLQRFSEHVRQSEFTIKAPEHELKAPCVPQYRDTTPGSSFETVDGTFIYKLV